jgi:predicted transcriptional regulator
MKTAISMPDEVFDQAEHLAKRLKLSRSELYSRALQEFVARHVPDRVTDALNEVCDAVDTRPDRFVSEAARGILDRNAW